MQNAMWRFQKILVPVDFSPNSANALHFALQFAEKNAAEVEILHVVSPEGASEFNFSVSRAPVVEEQVDSGRQVLGTFVQNQLMDLKAAPPKNNKVRQEVLAGSVVDRISEEARRRESDLIILGTRGKHNSLERWIGTIASGVVERAPCHVLIVPERAVYQDFEKIVCAVDLLTSDSVHLFRMANLLRHYGADYRCVHFQSANNGREHISPQELSSICRERIPTLRLEVRRAKSFTLVDDLNDYAEEQYADLVVLFKPLYGFWRRLLHQSVSRSMGIHSHLPLLVIKE